jgi:hypothetical protein
MTETNLEHGELSRESQLFAEKAARSVSEVHGKVSSIPDLVIFLEILGYNDSLVAKYGFVNVLDFARYIFDSIDYFRADSTSENGAFPTTQIKSIYVRILEALALAFPIVAMLALLMFAGISLWMTRIFAISITTAFLAGVFLGILVTEGSVQAFTRLFAFYYDQENYGEAKRILGRNGNFLLVALAISVGVLLLIGVFANIPLFLIFISIFSTITIATHRSSYVVIYALKKFGVLVLAYSAALITLYLSYTMTPPFFVSMINKFLTFLAHPITQETIPLPFARYFFSLLLAFLVLSIPPAYYDSKIMAIKMTSTSVKPPPFYVPMNIKEETVSSRFGVQLWESLPYFVFGTFFFLTVFADRILSWIFNPFVNDFGGGLPFAFNSAYHVGADPALAIMLLATIASYVVMAPVYDRLTIASSSLKVFEAGAVEDFLQKTYNQLLLVTILVTVSAAFILNYEALQIMKFLGGGVVSLEILRVASIADIFLSIFFVNAMFLTLVNKIKAAALISVVTTLVVVTAGMLFALVGYQYLIWAYLLATFVGMVASTTYCVRLRGNFSMLFFGRYI